MVRPEIYIAVVSVLAIIAFLYYYFGSYKKRERLYSREETTIHEEVQRIKEESPEIPMPEEVIDVIRVKGIGPKRSEKLKNLGIHSVKDLIEYDPKDLSEKIGISEKIVSQLIRNANDMISMK